MVHLLALEMAREHGVILLSLPGHTAHRLQPLNVSFFKPLTSYYIDEIEKWLRDNPGRCVTQFQVAAIFGRAYCRAASIGNIANGFARAGVWPVDRTVFQDHDFSARTALQNDSGTSPVEKISSNPGSPSTRAGCSSHISLDIISPLPKAFSTVKISRTSQRTQRATVLTSSPYKAQLELQEGKKKKMATASEPGCGNNKAKCAEVDSWFCDMCQQ
jgi:hypothetical protein